MRHPIHASSSAIFLLLSAGVPLGGSGCTNASADSESSPQQRANEKAQEAKREASETTLREQTKAAEVTREASKEVAAAARAATTAVAEANLKARGLGARAQANANVEVRKENRETAKGTTELREWSQKKMDDLDNTIDAARAKEQAATPKFHADFEAGMKAVEVRRDAMRADVGSIETQSATDMADFKARLDKEGDQLQDRVQELTAAL